MDNKEYNTYLKKLEEIHDKKFKDNKEYLESCKANKNLSPKDYKIQPNHKLDEYFAKYGHKLEKGQLLAYKKDELWLMNKKTTYWKIENDSDFIYFEAQKNLKPLWISLASLLVAGAVAGGVTIGVLLSKGNGDTSKIHTLTFDIENLKIEGIEDEHQFHSGDNITFDIKKADGLANAEAYTLPTESEIVYVNLDSEDVTYTVGEDKVTLSFTAPDNDVSISMGSYTPLYFMVDESVTSQNGSNTIGYRVTNRFFQNADSISDLIDPGQIQYSFTGKPNEWVDWDDGRLIDLDGITGGVLYVKNNKNSLNQTSPYNPFDSDPNKYMFNFLTEGNIAIGGNVNSMLNYSKMAPYAFAGLFSEQGRGKTETEEFAITKLLSDFKLPATKLDVNCYSDLFSRCQRLNPSLELPATTLADACYRMMFGYTSITSAPELPATTLADHCYAGMFAVTPLEDLPNLPATTLADYCYEDMFEECFDIISLNDFELPATTLTKGCYSGMFNYSGVVSASFCLPAKTLTEECYKDMFSTCNNLISAPEMSIATLAKQCCKGMFEDCSSLKIREEVGETTKDNKIFTCPDTSSVSYPVEYMFDNINSSSSFDGDPTSGNTYYWYE